MQIDERALNFIQKAKAAGFSQQEVYEELLAKGYEIGAPRVEQPTEPEKSPYSTMDKVKYTLRAAGEAAPFGMGDLVEGYVGAQARNLADYTHGKDLKTRVKGLGKLAFGIISPEDFKKERADFIKGQEEFAKHHGGLNFAGEMVGGLLTGGAGAARNVIGKQGIKALMNAGAREGAKFGAAYGAGSALTQDTDKISVPEALKGGLVGGAGGALIGGALPPAIAVGAKALSPVVKGGKAVAKKIATILKNDAQQANQALGNAGYVATDMTPENKVFFNLLEANPEGTMEAVRKGDPLIAHANRQQLRRTRGAVTADEKADEAFIEAKRAFDQGKIQKGEDISDRLLSKESGYTATERIADEAHSKYQPLYEEVMKTGEIDLPQEIISNETILGAIQEAQSRAGYTKLKANNVRVLDKAKRVLQDKYKSLQRAGKNDEAREYQIAKEELVNFMDSKLPQYAEARKAFMEGQELQEFVDLGRRIKNISHAEVERIAKTLTPEEQQALKAGIGDSVRESLYNTRNEGSNVLEKAFPAPLRRKLEVLGIKDEEIAKEIGKELQTNKNYQFVGGGSNTMNKAEDVAKLGFGPLVRTIKAIRNPLGTLEKAADKLDNKIAGLDSEEIARLMFNAEALAKEAKKPEHQRRIAEILRKSKQDKSGQSISGYLGGKLKEKGGYAMKDLGVDEFGNRVVDIDGNKFTNKQRQDRGTRTFGLYDNLGHSGRAEAAYADGLVDEFQVMDEIKRLFPEATEEQAKKIKNLAYSEWHHSDLSDRADKQLDFYDLTGRKFFDEEGNFIDPIAYANKEISKETQRTNNRATLTEYLARLKEQNKGKELKKIPEYMETPNEYTADVSFPEFVGKGKFAGNKELKDVKVVQKGSTYKIYDQNGNLLYTKRESPNLKISNQNYGEKYNAYQKSIAEAQENNSLIKGENAAKIYRKNKPFYSFLKKMAKEDYELSQSGNAYIKGQKPRSAEVPEGLLRIADLIKREGEEKAFVGHLLQQRKNGSWEDVAQVESYPHGDLYAIVNYLKQKQANRAVKRKSVKQGVNSLGEPVAKTEEGVKNFKKWFKGSKVVDEQGKPLVVYHGGAKDINIFDYSKIGQQGRSEGAGFEFTANKNLAQDYAKNRNGDVYATYLNIKKPITDIEQKTLTKNQKLQFLKRFNELVNEDKTFVKEMGKDSVFSDYGGIEEALKAIEYDRDLDIINELINTTGRKEEALKAFADVTGYDGVILKKGNDWFNNGLFVTFKNNNIKSVKNSGKFDPKNPNIYKSLIGGLGISQILKSKENK